VQKASAAAGAPQASVETGAGSQAVADGSVAKADEAGEERKSKGQRCPFAGCVKLMPNVRRHAMMVHMPWFWTSDKVTVLQRMLLIQSYIRELCAVFFD
jgi:hypothetical protein